MGIFSNDNNNNSGGEKTGLLGHDAVTPNVDIGMPDVERNNLPPTLQRLILQQTSDNHIIFANPLKPIISVSPFPLLHLSYSLRHCPHRALSQHIQHIEHAIHWGHILVLIFVRSSGRLWAAHSGISNQR